MDTESGWVELLFKKVMAGEYLLAAAAGLMLVVFLARHERLPLVKWLPFLATKWGGWALSFALSLLGAVGTALLSGHAIDGSLLMQALYVALAAAAGWELKKDMIA